MLNEISLKGKTALITGGGSGIGLGIAQEMKDAGAKIVIVGRREAVLREAAAALGGNTRYIPFDLARTEALGQLVDEVERETPIDILVNCAGINIKKPFLEFSEQDFMTVMEIQEKAAFFLTRAVAERMKLRRAGAIIMISSLSARQGMPNNQVYTLCKGGIVALTRSLMVELAPWGIRVNSVNPGYILTDMIRQINVSTPERLEKMQNLAPLKRFGTPREIGMAAAFLASDAASFITGIDLLVDGGLSNASTI